MERMAQMIQAYKPTSKASLKQYCMLVAQGNVDEATKIYDFFLKGMEDLPMFDPPQPTAIDSIKNTISGVLDIFNDNKDSLAQGYEVLRGIMAARGKNLPPLAAPAQTVAEPLNPIN